MKFVGLAVCFAIIAGTATMVGIHLFLDMNSLVFVLGEQPAF